MPILTTGMRSLLHLRGELKLFSRLPWLSPVTQLHNKHRKLFLVVHSPRYNGRPVQVDGTGGVIAPVHGDHRYMARHLCNTAFSETLFTTFD